MTLTRKNEGLNFNPAQVEEHQARADQEVGDKGNSIYLRHIRDGLQKIRISCELRFIFCNLTERVGNIKTDLFDHSSVTCCVVWGNPRLPNLVSPSGLGRPSAHGNTAAVAVNGIQIAMQESVPLLHASRPPKSSPSVRTPAPIEKRRFGAASTPRIQPSRKSHQSSSSKVEIAKEEFSPLLLKNQLDEIVCASLAKKESILMKHSEKAGLSPENFETTMRRCQAARIAWDEIVEKIGTTPLSNPINDADIKSREARRQTLIGAARAMWIDLAKYEPEQWDARPLNETLDRTIQQLARKIWFLRTTFLWRITAWIGSTIATVLGVLFYHSDRAPDLPILVGLLVASMSTIVGLCLFVSFFSHPLKDLALVPIKATLADKMVVSLMIQVLQFGPRWLCSFLFNQNGLESLLRSMKHASEWTRQSWEETAAEKQYAEMSSAAETTCSRAMLDRLQNQQAQLLEARESVERLRMVLAELSTVKKDLNKIKLRIEGASPEQLPQLEEDKRTKDAKRAELKRNKVELGERIKVLSGLVDREKGEIRCWLPELFLAVHWLQAQQDMKQQPAPRTSSEALFDLVKDDLKIDLDAEDVEDVSGNEVNVLEGRIGVLCKRIKATDEVKLWKNIPWTSVESDALNRLRVLKRELCNSRRVIHPNILPCEGTVIRSGDSRGRIEHLYLQFAFQSGGDVDHWLRRSERPVGRKLDIITKVSGALKEMHRIGLCHRDVKPMNIVMSTIDDDAEPKLTDFGDSKLLNADGIATHRTMRSDGVGTTGFMAPELERGVPREMTENSADALKRWSACDVYSCSVTAVRVLCGSMDNTSDDALQLLLKTRTELEKSLSGLVRSKDVIDMLRRGLDKDWMKRPSMHELSRLLAMRTCSLCVQCADRNGVCDSRNGVLCPLGTHFVCESDFTVYIEKECERPIGERLELDGKFTCAHGIRCSLKHFFTLEALRRALRGNGFEKILESVREIMETKEVRSSKLREDELRRVLLNASAKEFHLIGHRTHITDDIATGRCPGCKAAWYDFVACCALSCNQCKANFCAFCGSTSFKDRPAAVYPDAHAHVARCAFNPDPGQMFCDPVRFVRRVREMRKDALRMYLDSIQDAEMQRMVREDGAVRAVMADLGMI